MNRRLKLDLQMYDQHVRLDKRLLDSIESRLERRVTGFKLSKPQVPSRRSEVKYMSNYGCRTSMSEKQWIPLTGS